MTLSLCLFVLTSPPDPLGPLKKQNYFHGFLSRPEAERLLVEDGKFLIHESSKKPGQYVLTGMANGTIQHLLLMNKQGKIKHHNCSWAIDSIVSISWSYRYR